MAMKIRCTECTKKVSIDEAFAGGMCRCPYCKALVYVPESKGTSAAQRPAAPGARPETPETRPEAPALRPGEPGAPGEAEAAAAPAAAEDHEQIPMARPVKIQGIITIILLVLLLLMVAAGVVITLLYIGDPKGNGRDVPDYEARIDPLAVSKEGPAVAGVKLTASPIIFVIDAGSSMRETFDAARVMTGSSAVSLGEKLKFNLLLAEEDEDKFLSPDYTDGGQAGKDAVAKFLEGLAPSGASDVPRALKAALDKDPKVIVLIARKVVDNARDVANEAKGRGVIINTIAIDGDPEVNLSMKKLAELTGGEAEEYYSAEF